MDLAKVLAHLHSELENLNAAIASLERLQQGKRRRGRPPDLLRGSGKTDGAARKDKSKLESLPGGAPPRGA